MAQRAVRREARGDVVWIVRRVIGSQMACRAGRRSKIVVIVEVTLRARRGQMRSGKRESRLGMVERRRHPRRCCVARVTSLRESGRHMVGVRRLVEIREMTARAHKRQGGVVVVHVTQRALGSKVCPGQGERGLGVIEGRAKPCGRRVTQRAIRREPSGHVVWTGRRVVGRQMACRTGPRIQGVVIVDVTLRTRCGQMRPGKYKPRLGMIERCRLPRRCGVARVASLREAGCHMIGVRGLVVIRDMTARALSWQGQVVIVHVALRALGGKVCAGQRKCSLGMIKSRA